MVDTTYLKLMKQAKKMYFNYKNDELESIVFDWLEEQREAVGTGVYENDTHNTGTLYSYPS